MSDPSRPLIRVRAIAASLLLLVSGPALAYSPNPDLTAPGAIAALKADANSAPLYNVTYNLGPTGLRGWIFIDRANKGAEGLMTDQSRQILVTHVGAGTPAAGGLGLDDVILGVGWGTGGSPVAPFDGDCRKAFGRAIGEAEKAENGGILWLKRWRSGTTSDVQITLPVMGTYAETAPFECPKSALILANAIPILEAETLSGDWKGAVSALALLSTGDPDHVPAVRTLARSLSDGSASLQTGRGLDTWNSGYVAVLLAEYFLATGDTYVLPGIHNYAVALSRSQSLYGTFGHKGSMLRSDGGYNGSIPWYGPVNSAGLVANLGIVLGKKAIVASGGAVEPEIDPAIARASNFFSYYVNKGGIPYGEHETWPAHADNGKGGMAAVMFALMGDKPVQTEYYARLCISSHVGEEYGHTGQGFSYLWTTLGANTGGASAAAAFLREVRWHRDLSRRGNGSFIYDGGEQYSGSTVADYWSASSYYGLSPTATYILQLTLPLRQLHITGKNANPAATLSSAVVANAVWAGLYSQQCSGYSTNQLLAAFSEYDTVVRDAAAIELGARAGEFATLIPQLIVMAEDMTDVRKREAACHALGYMGSTDALPALGRRLSDPDPWVRTRAAAALGRLGSLALPQLNTMLTAFVTNATDPNVIEWDDPIQIANGYLANVLFNTQPFRTEIRNQPPELFYAAVRAGLQQPDGRARGALANLIKQDLNWNDVRAVAPDLVEAVMERSPADQMFSEGIRYAGLETLAKFKVEEGLPLCLMVKEQNWHSDDWKPFQLLRDTYGTAAAEVLPTLYDWRDHLPAFDADGSISAERYANIESYINSTIAALEAGTPPPALSFFKTVDIVSTTAPDPTRLQLVAAATDLDGGVPRYRWSCLSGPGTVTFSPNGTTASASTVASFETPGTYMLRVAVADSTILDGGVWSKPVLGYFDFQTYGHDYGLAYADRSIVIVPGTNWPPVAYAQEVVAGLATARNLTLVGFDYDGDALDYAIITPPAHGTLSGVPPAVSYTPTPGYVGSDVFTFEVTDSRGLSSAPATVSIAVRNPLEIQVNFEKFTPSPGTPEVESTLGGPAGNLGSEWNQIAANAGGVLVDSAGAATPVAFATTASEGRTWGNPSLKMLHSALTHFGKGQDMTLTISGLTDGGRYNVWLTSHGNLTSSAERAHGIWSTTHPTTSASAQTINGVTTLNGSTWEAGNNFVLFENVVADGSGRIAFLGDATDVGEFDTLAYRLPLNGFQLVELPPVPPAAPTGLVAAAGDAQVELTWNAIPGATGYLVKRAGTPGGPYVTRANPAATRFLDAPASNGQVWYYVVSAVDGYGEGADSEEVSATPEGLLPPEAPAGLVAVAGDAVVELSWNPSPTATSYVVKRGIRPGGPYLALATPETPGFHDATVLNGMTWYYVVSAVNAGGEGSNSEEVAALPQAVTQVINVNMNAWTGSGAVGSEAGSTLDGPAGGLGTTWNQFAAASSGGTLVTFAGAATTVAFTTTASAGYTWGSPALKMLHSGVTHFSKGTNTTLTITGLTPGTRYMVWLTSHDNNSSAAERAHGIWSTTNATTSASAQTVNGVTTLNGTTWEAGNNYVLFENVVADGSGRMVFLGDATDAGEFGTLAYRLPLNGFQIWQFGSESPPPFRVWTADPVNGLTPGVNDGPADDPEPDGLANLLEFALGGNPLADSAGIRPTIRPQGAGWVYEYDRSNLSAPPATIQTVEYGTDLTGWTTVAIPATSAGPVTITPGSPSDHVSVAIPDLGARGFVRLRVTE
jgi:HEAT repeat protein